MDYENFKENFIEALKEKFYETGNEVKTDSKKVEKLNGGYDAVTVTPEGANMGVTLRIEAFFEAYENGISMDEVVDKAFMTTMDNFSNQPEIDVSSLTDYDQMKDKLVMEVVATDINTELLSKVPHVDMEDMSVVYRFVFENNENGRATILATNDLIEIMGITPEQLHADALENAPQIKPAVITGMSEMLAELMGQEEAEMMGLYPVAPEDEQIYVASVPDKVMGAGVLAYQDFMDQAAERVGGDFFILPSSRHEILLVPDNGQMDLHDLEAMVREVNATHVAPEDKLTDNVYHYDADAKIFELGEKFVERQNEKEAAVESKEAVKDSVLSELASKKEEVARQPKKDAIEKTAKTKGGEAI